MGLDQGMTMAKTLTLPTSASALNQRSAHRVSDLTVRTVTVKELADYVPAWQLLASRALVPNPFYEPWMLLPAIQHLKGSAQLEVLLVFGPAKLRGGERDLLGLFPLEVHSKFLHLPIRTLSLWQHLYCFLNVPLVDQENAWPVIEAFWRWWETGPFRCHVFDTNLFLAEGRFHEIWTDFAIGRSALVLHEYARAAIYPVGNAESYIAAAVSKKHRQEYSRQERKLREIGICQFREVTNPAEVDDWIEAFLRVEAAGWKGAPGGGAFASSPEDSRFFRAITQKGFEENRVMLLRFDLDNAPLALKYNLLSGTGSFAFKIAFDENFSKYSPGVLLELENIQRAFDHGGLEWMDSCATARHPVVDRLWSERRMVRRTLFSDSSRTGDLIVSFLPLLRWVNDRIRRQSVPMYRRISTKSEQ